MNTKTAEIQENKTIQYVTTSKTRGVVVVRVSHLEIYRPNESTNTLSDGDVR